MTEVIKELVPTEHDIQSSFFKWVRMRGLFDKRYFNVFAIPNARQGSFGAREYYKREGLERGVPDVFVAAASPPFHGMFIEFKRPGGKPKPEQQNWLDRLTLAGYYCIVCHDWEVAVRELQRYLGAHPSKGYEPTTEARTNQPIGGNHEV